VSWQGYPSFRNDLDDVLSFRIPRTMTKHVRGCEKSEDKPRGRITGLTGLGGWPTDVSPRTQALKTEHSDPELSGIQCSAFRLESSRVKLLIENATKSPGHRLARIPHPTDAMAGMGTWMAWPRGRHTRCTCPVHATKHSCNVSAELRTTRRRICEHAAGRGVVAGIAAVRIQIE
jgi:hypothetical protein